MLIAAVMAAAITLPACGKSTGEPASLPWQRAIEAMDRALARGDVSAAMLARQAAYRAAVEDRRWDAMAALGDATVRLAHASAIQAATLLPEARRVYLAALFRARRQGSVEGVLRATEAFAALGDKDVAREGLLMAATMAASSGNARDVERVQAVTDRLGQPAPLPVTPAQEALSHGAAAAALQ